MRPRNIKGFTLIELLVVIAIIGILAGVVVSNLGTAREEAQISSAVTQLREINTAIFRLELDTGKSIGGCPIGVFSGGGNEVSITSPRSGLISAPTDFGNYAGCQWFAAEAALWNGPYIKSPLDPWGNSYFYDSDYFPRQDAAGLCPNPYPPGVPYSVVVSGGPNGVNGGATVGGPYDCDDIFYIIDS